MLLSSGRQVAGDAKIGSICPLDGMRRPDQDKLPPIHREAEMGEKQKQKTEGQAGGKVAGTPKTAGSPPVTGRVVPIRLSQPPTDGGRERKGGKKGEGRGKTGCAG